jgi:hypothetical protein
VEGMEGYHYLMKIGHFLNVMAANSELLNKQVKELGIQGFFQKIWMMCCYADYLERTRILLAATMYISGDCSRCLDYVYQAS